MTPRASSFVAVALLTAALLSAGGALVLLALSWSAPLPEIWGFRGYQIVIGSAYALVGALVAMRRRGNPVGWLLLTAGLVNTVEELALEYAAFAVAGRATPLPAGVLAAWFGSWVWGLSIGVLLPALLLLFPDGRQPLRRWTWLFWAFVTATGGTLGPYMALRPGPLMLAPYLDNPYALLPPETAAVIGTTSIALLLPEVALLVASVLVRFRRSRDIERQQLKWLAFAIVPYGVAGFLSAALPDKVWQLAFIALQAFVPVAIGIAILRYRLYDIDVLINRTLVYGALSAALVATYAAFVILLQSALRPFTGGSQLAVAASTIATFLLAQPLRQRIQDAVDRRFYRRRYDAVRLLDTFGARLRDEVELDAVRTDLLDVVGRAVEPAQASLWLKETAR